jgi:hypothetical protein
MFAAGKGRSDVVQLLVSKGAEVDAKDNRGRTAVLHALEAGEVDVVGWLLNNGSDLSLTGYKTQDELKVALHNFRLLKFVASGTADDVKVMLDRGADPNARNGRGQTALSVAVARYDNEIIKLLLAKGANVNVADTEGNTPLMLAAAGNNQEGARLLLDYKPEVNVANKEKKTALLLASEGGHTRVAELLLNKGADVRARDAEGNTALLLASREDSAQQELVELLLAKGADPNDRDSEGNTALMLAARAGAFQVIEPLLAAGTEVNATNKQGWTALRHVKESKESWTRQEWAADHRAEVIRLLVKGGAKE